MKVEHNNNQFVKWSNKNVNFTFTLELRQDEIKVQGCQVKENITGMQYLAIRGSKKCSCSQFFKSPNKERIFEKITEFCLDVFKNSSSHLQIQCPPLNRITLGRHRSNNNNRMIQCTDVCYTLFYITGPAIFYYNERLILLSVIPLSGGHCKKMVYIKTFLFS